MKKIILISLTALLSIWGLQAQSENMELVYDTGVSPGTTIALLLSGQVRASVDWGDNAREQINQSGFYEHSYEQDGVYTVTISGQFMQFGDSTVNNPYADKLIRVESFGNTGLVSLAYAFHNATNLDKVPDALPRTVQVLSGTFKNASKFNQNISGWKVGSVIATDEMFSGAAEFNQDIGDWDVSKTLNMSEMFKDASSFNRDIGNWDVSKVTNMGGMFSGALHAEKDLGNWDVSKVTNMKAMFKGATSFNGNVATWNVSSVEDMSEMFSGATEFN